MSFQQLWQKQRQQRQQEVVQRQLRVQETLTFAHQERQSMRAELQQELNLFRAAIANQEQIRRQEFQQLQTQMQQFCIQLRDQVQNFLSVANDQRCAQAPQVAATLAEFVQNLRLETQALLLNATTERSLMAQQLEKDLSIFVHTLQADVQDYLQEIELVRQERAVQLNRELAQSRIDRKAEVAAMFCGLAQFRAELREFRINLYNQIWGDDLQPELSAKPTISNSQLTNSSQQHLSLSRPAVKAFPQDDSTAVMPAKNSNPAAKDSPAWDEQVYNFVQAAQGARLTQIEAALNINRFQAVDALKSLIKAERITQRDRIYYAIKELPAKDK